MLDVCFSDSVKGALAVLVERAEAQENFRSNLIGLSFSLSLSDIAAPIERGSCPRKSLLSSWLSSDPWGELGDMRCEIESFYQGCIEDLQTLKERSKQGEALRLWIDKTPDAACGLLFVASLLETVKCEISIVRLQMDDDDKSIADYNYLNDLSYDDLVRLTANSSVLSNADRRKMALKWRGLKAENAPLRTVIEDNVVSVREDYYDLDIKSQLCGKPITVATLIGRTLLRRRIRVSDWFIGERIKYLISSGCVRVVKPDLNRFYNTTVVDGSAV